MPFSKLGRLLEKNARISKELEGTQRAIKVELRRIQDQVTGSLTPRETQILSFVRANLCNKEIADQLGISVRGVKLHVSSLLAKYKVDSRHKL